MRKFAMLATFAVTATAFAQLPPVQLPEVSQKASASQTIGVTNITIDYHRPGVNGRKIWGDLVPYGEVWRAGANENTTISFSTPVKVEGQPLDAGTYGLHMIPTASTWTIIFSKDHRAWGSYAYDQKQDALRVTVTPQTADNVERLAYSFDDPTANSVVVALRWEKLRVPFKVDVDLQQTVGADIRQQLTGLPQFGWEGWNAAATWALRNNGDLNEALTWVNKSIDTQPSFRNLRTKAAIVEKQGDAKQAAELRARALTVATQQDLNGFGYSLNGQKKYDEAIDILRRNTTAHADDAVAWQGLGDAYAAKGDKKAAMDAYNKALSLTKDDDAKKAISASMKKLQ